MYDGSVRVTYVDNTHAYYIQNRLDYGLADGDEKAWAKKYRAKGVTTILGDTLEKKGLMTWPLGLALTELFGFYDFEPEPGNRLQGFSKGKGSMWDGDGLLLRTQTEMLPVVLSASKAWQRRQKQGADIGSLVHEAIENYITNKPFKISLEQYEAGQDFVDATAHAEWLLTAQAELKMADMAFDQFMQWWDKGEHQLISAEQVVYSKEYNVAGAYDALLTCDGKTILTDWKTSKASVSAGAPQGVYYSYFIQSAAYAAMMLEMGAVEKIDDLMVVSCRKDGNFNTVLASEVGLSVDDAIDWWKAVALSYRHMDKVKKELIKLGEVK